MQRNFPSQAAATREILGAAKCGDEEFVEECIAKGAEVNGYRDAVRESLHMFLFLISNRLSSHCQKKKCCHFAIFIT